MFLTDGLGIDWLDTGRIKDSQKPRLWPTLRQQKASVFADYKTAKGLGFGRIKAG